MATNLSLDLYKQIIVALLSDVQTLHSEVFTKRALRLTTEKLIKRLDREGIGFLTKTLFRLGRAFDRALSGEVSFNAAELRFESKPGSKLPRFLGELFERVFSHDGRILPTPCVTSIKSIRQILLPFGKLELPNDPAQNQRVIEKFKKTDQELAGWNRRFEALRSDPTADAIHGFGPNEKRILKRAEALLREVFCNFNVLDIHPKHGPGSVSTGERLHEKYTWSVISPRILQTYPLDAYFFASNGHVCDSLVKGVIPITFGESPAKVVLVPKDSRGPRLISEEPLAFQWVQQGLGRAIVQHVEKHPLTRYSVHFTDQSPNQFGALLGSKAGRWATLDLNEASDRVSIGLVNLLFPEHLRDALMNCRSLGTVLPGGEFIKLEKFAPMGSALCFPVLALTIWAILKAGILDAECPRTGRHCIHCGETFCEDVLVYGDDVIVKTARAANAIELLESVGLKVNRDKSFISGSFRESCGTDAFAGVPVTPVRLRTVWSSSQSPESYVSYIAYANALHKMHFYHAYDVIVSGIFAKYGEVPDQDMKLSCPSLVAVPQNCLPRRSRTNRSLQKREWRVRDVAARPYRKVIDGWKMLLRYFAESTTDCPLIWDSTTTDVATEAFPNGTPSCVSQYTKRKSIKFVFRWR